MPFCMPNSTRLFGSSISEVTGGPTITSFFREVAFAPLTNVARVIPPKNSNVNVRIVPIRGTVSTGDRSISLRRVSC